MRIDFYRVYNNDTSFKVTFNINLYVLTYHQVGPTILKKRGSHYYIITTDTGNRQDAGTTARVVFTMSGDQGETLPVWLHDRERPYFERGQRNTFVVSYPHEIGDLSYVQIWHDNAGTSF